MKADELPDLLKRLPAGMTLVGAILLDTEANQTILLKFEGWRPPKEPPADRVAEGGVFPPLGLKGRALRDYFDDMAMGTFVSEEEENSPYPQE